MLAAQFAAPSFRSRAFEHIETAAVFLGLGEGPSENNGFTSRYPPGGRVADRLQCLAQPGSGLFLSVFPRSECIAGSGPSTCSVIRVDHGLFLIIKTSVQIFHPSSPFSIPSILFKNTQF